MSIIVFSHLMKTGGTSLNQHLKGCYGSKMHVVTKSKNLLIDGQAYKAEELKIDLERNLKLKVLSGHQVRPFVHFGEFESQLKWLIILRHPYKRFISHYIQIINREGSIHKGLSLYDWTKKENASNYMVKFIAGSENIDLAKSILLEKFQVVGLTENMDTSLKMMRAIIGDNNFTAPNELHKNLSTDNSLRDSLLKSEIDFIKDNNKLDLELYEFAKDKIWKKQLAQIDLSNLNNKKRSHLAENLNKIRFQIKRYNYHSGKLTWGNLKYFLRNW